MILNHAIQVAILSPPEMVYPTKKKEVLLLFLVIRLWTLYVSDLRLYFKWLTQCLTHRKVLNKYCLMSGSKALQANILK